MVKQLRQRQEELVSACKATPKLAQEWVELLRSGPACIGIAINCLPNKGTRLANAFAEFATKVLGKTWAGVIMILCSDIETMDATASMDSMDAMS